MFTNFLYSPNDILDIDSLTFNLLFRQVRERCIMQAQNGSRCQPCQSENEKTFTGEIAIHFPGLRGLNKPVVWVFPEISVCLDCGLAEFKVPERELEVLRTGAPVDGAAVWLGGSHTP
jgi:hypothetical protein